ncbi:MAG: hypothetical protein V3R64_10315 [Sphingomonadales bacterium]
MILKRIATGIKNQDWFVVMVELLIVVVGIYIGLQVDDWNKEREAKEVTKTYYSRLIEDLETGKEASHLHIAYFEQTTKHGLGALKALNTPDAELGEQFIIDIYQVTQSLPHDPHRRTYDELLASGIANAIPDHNIRAKLANFYNGLGLLGTILEEETGLRNTLRMHMPFEIQTAIRQNCGDHISFSENFLLKLQLSESCQLDLEPDQVTEALNSLANYSDLKKDVIRKLSDLEVKLNILKALLTPVDAIIADLEEARK